MDISVKEKDEILEKAGRYVQDEKDDFFRSEVEGLIEKNDVDELYERFYTSLSFGTAGMRGVIGGGTNRINTFMVRKVTQGLCQYLSSFESPSVTIAYDSRHYSKEFALSAALVLAANGIKTYLYDTLHPVPMLSFAVRHLKSTAGIVVTASHNPSKYNGYKVYWSDGGQVTPPHDVGIAKLANSVEGKDIKDISEEEARAKGILESVPESVDRAYFDMVKASLRRPEVFASSKIKVAYTPLHGSGNVPVRTILKELGVDVEVVKEQEAPDGAFPTVKLPNPESHEAMEKVIELAKSVKADIVFGTDPDADRLGLAIPKDKDKSEYVLLTGNQIATLLADYLLSTRKELYKGSLKAVVVKSIVTTDIIKKIAEENGAEAKDVLTGFKYIAEVMESIDEEKVKEHQFLFGCEESYGFLTVNEVHDKDAVSSLVAATEMMAYYAGLGKSLIERLEEIYDEYGYYTERVFSRDYEGSSGKEKMRQIMAKLRSLSIGDELAGRKISEKRDLLSDDDTGLPKSDVLIFTFTSSERLVVRPSGTEPKIKYYIFFSAEKGNRKELEENLPKLLSEFQEAL